MTDIFRPELLLIFRNLSFALLFGAVVGFERQRRQRRAGLRTNALVALGAASFVTLSMLIDNEASPTRVAAQVVSGIGFLGAGVIIRDGLSIRGLNTAATLWAAASIGVLSGSGYVVEGAMVTLLVVLAHVVLRPLGRLVERERDATELRVNYRADVTCAAEHEAQIRALLLQALSGTALQLRSLRSRDTDKQAVRVRALLFTQGRQDETIERIASRLSLEPSVTEISWEATGG